MAHDLVLIPDDQGNLTIKLGHPGEYELPDLHKLYELTGYSSADSPGVSLLGISKAAGAELKMIGLNELISGKPVMVGGQYDNGYWTTIAKDTYFNASKLLVPNAKEGSHNMKFGKGLAPGATLADYQRKLGHRIEIIPQSDPFTAKVGGKLAVQVLYLGEPLPGIGLEIGDGEKEMAEENIPRYKTDAKGIAELPIRKIGLQIIALDYQTKPSHADLADHDEYSAALTFVLPGGK